MWLILIAGAIVTLTWLIRQQYNYWQRQGVFSAEAKIPFGSLKESVLGKKSAGIVIHEIYNKYKEQSFVGIYLLFKPALLIRDAELARGMLVQNFSSFHDRGTDSDVTDMLFAMRGESWKTLRAKLTPLFSTGRLKGMLPTVNEIGDRLVKHLEEQQANGGEIVVDMKEAVTTYAIDIIGSVFFGLDVDSFKNRENEFRAISDAFIKPPTWLDNVHGLGSFLCPNLAKFIEYFGFISTPIQKVRDLIKHTVQAREQNNIVRRDFLQLLLQLRNSGKINDDDSWYVETAAEEFKSMSINTIADQCSLFYIAGSETTSVTASFTLYELSMYPELLQKAVEEVESVLAKHELKPSDAITYEAIKDMTFLELCLMETVRKYPGLPFLNRECTKDFKIPNTDYTIKQGTAVLISTLGLHMDPEHFPDPTRYDPYRFTDEQRNYNAEAYLPFGEGPRHCIAKRMGSVNSKLAVIKVLANFDIEPREREEIELAYTQAVAFIPKGGLIMKLKKKKNAK